MRTRRTGTRKKRRRSRTRRRTRRRRTTTRIRRMRRRRTRMRRRSTKRRRRRRNLSVRSFLAGRGTTVFASPMDCALWSYVTYEYKTSKPKLVTMAAVFIVSSGVTTMAAIF
jgi:hypothetical protein